MEKPSVTLRHETAYLLAGFMFIITAAGVVLTCVMPADQETRQISLVVAMLLMFVCVMCVFWGGSTETLNENGVFIKRPFFSKQYSWNDVKKVSVEVKRTRGGKIPEFLLKIENRRIPLALDYTKRTMHCITYYYGEPDQDKWGKPPILM